MPDQGVNARIGQERLDLAARTDHDATRRRLIRRLFSTQSRRRAPMLKKYKYQKVLISVFKNLIYVSFLIKKVKIF